MVEYYISLQHTVLLAFCHCDQISEKYQCSGRIWTHGSSLVHSWLVSLLWGCGKADTSWQKGKCEESCSPHGNLETEREEKIRRGRGHGPDAAPKARACGLLPSTHPTFGFCRLQFCGIMVWSIDSSIDEDKVPVTQSPSESPIPEHERLLGDILEINCNIHYPPV